MKIVLMVLENLPTVILNTGVESNTPALRHSRYTAFFIMANIIGRTGAIREGVRGKQIKGKREVIK